MRKTVDFICKMEGPVYFEQVGKFLEGGWVKGVLMLWCFVMFVSCEILSD